MKVSVVVCSHDIGRLPWVVDCLASLHGQTHRPVEVVVVVDGDHELFEALDHDAIDRTAFNGENRGLLASRNRGAELATGEVVAFIDDDARASPHWLAELVRLYREYDAVAAGGELVPEWESDRPRHLPHEFDWLVGATHRGFAPNGVTEVRNTFGSNLSFRAAVFEALGGFDATIGGLRGDGQFQGGETELCCRLGAEYGQGVIYSPDAVVYHTVPDARARFRPCLRRAYYQGRSKARLAATADGDLGAERGFVATVGRGLVDRAVRLVTLPTYTAAVAAGYAREVAASRLRATEPAPGHIDAPREREAP